MFYADQGGYGVRPESELLRMMAIPIRAREDMVNRIANYRQGAYTAQQFVDWYKSEPLSDEDFEWALDQWKQEFPMNPQTRGKIEERKDQNTRGSKKKRGTWLMAPLMHSFNKSA